MTHSLNFRLLAAFTLVIIVIIGTVFFFTYRNTRGEISRIGERLQTAQDRRVETELARYYQFAGTWDGVQPAGRPAGPSFTIPALSLPIMPVSSWPTLMKN